MKYSGWPESGELVVGEVDEINQEDGVYVDLSEYEDKRGFIHISEVASGWIKNIRDHVSEGERVVCKVLDIDERRQQIDLSLKDVNEHQRKDKIQDWKNEQKADKWMTLAFGEDVSEETYAGVANGLIAAYGSLYDGFEQAAIHGHEALEDTDLDDDEREAVVDVARENVSVPFVKVTGYVDLESPSADGVEDVREAMEAAEGNGEVPASETSGGSEDERSDSSGVPDEAELEVTYVGAPEYRIRVKAPNYKTAESELEAAAERASEAIEAVGGEGQYHRERHSDEE